MKKLILICIILISFFCSVKAQLSTEEIPYSWEKGKAAINIGSIPITYMPNLDLETLNREDLENDNLGIPYRFGFSHKVNLSLSNSGIWERTSDGGRIWTMRIYSPDAVSLNLLYDQFWLPEGAKFFLYSEDQKQHIGAFTSLNNKGNRENMRGFATGFLFTNSIVLEYYEPQEVAEAGVISISDIVSGYRDVNRKPDPPPTLLECFEDVNCYENYEQEKNAVALMVMKNVSCSGALLNTTANDHRPVFLTANHCFVDTVPIDQWVFYWNYENPCFYIFNVTTDPNKSTSGADLLARNDGTDFMLLNLTEDPASNNNVTPYYLGWDRSGSTSSGGFCIHHPANPCLDSLFIPEILPKKIAITSRDIVVSHVNTLWLVRFTIGVVFAGSSGSPLLNQDRRVIGQLCCGNEIWCKYLFSKPTNYEPDVYYGRFDLSWDGVDNSSRLRDWLDPLNTGDFYVDGALPCTKVYANQIITNYKDIVGCDVLNIYNVTITESATVNITAAEAIIMNANFFAARRSNVWIRIEETGGKSPASLLLTNSGNNFEEPDMQYSTSDYENHIITSPNFSFHPNPNPGTFQIETNFPLSDIAHLKITNLLGVAVYETQNVASPTIQLQNPAAGTFFVVMVLKDGAVLTRKMVVQ